MNYQLLKQSIDSVITSNHNNEITGQILRQVLNEMVNSLGAYYQFVGVADLSTDFGTPDPKVAYIAATEGTYNNGLTLRRNQVGIMYFNGYNWLLSVANIPQAGRVNLQVHTNNPTINSLIKELYVWDNNYSANAVYRVNLIARHYSGNNQWAIGITKNGQNWLRYYTAVNPEDDVMYFNDTVNGMGLCAVINWDMLEDGTQIYDATGWEVSHNIFKLAFSPYVAVRNNKQSIDEINERLEPLGQEITRSLSFVAQAGQQNLVELPGGEGKPVSVTVRSASNVPALRVITRNPYSQYDLVEPKAGDYYQVTSGDTIILAVVDATEAGSVDVVVSYGLYETVEEHQRNLENIGLFNVYRYSFAAQSALQNLAFIGDFEGSVSVRIKSIDGSITKLRLGVDSPYAVTDITAPKAGDVYQVSGVTKDGSNLYLAVVGADVAGSIEVEVSQNKIKELTMLSSIVVGDKTEDIMRTIDCIGDSLTMGAGGLPYTGFLKTALRDRFLVNNFGVGGENAGTILGRMNGVPYEIAAGFTIPAAVSAVAITLTNIYGQRLLPILQGDTSLLVRIAGVDGLLTTTQTNPSAQTADYYFTRATAGAAVDVAAGERVWIRSTSQAQQGFRNKIIWIGQNGGYGLNETTRYDGNPNLAADVSRLVEMIRTYIGVANPAKYIILSPTQNTSELLETTMAREFGGAFFNTRKWIMANGIRVAQEVGMLGPDYPTADDLADIANGLIPRCLRVDNVHFNSAGYSAVGYGVAYQIKTTWGID